MILLLLHKLALIAPTWLPTLITAVTGADHDAGHAAGDDHGGDHGEDHSGPPHLPSLIKLVFGHGLLYDWSDIIYAWGTILFLVAVAITAYSRRSMIPAGVQNVVEMYVEGMYSFFKSILGDHEARRYTPYLGTLFIYIFVNNLWGLIPGGHSPSTSINITGTLAIATFCYAQYTGMARLGILGYLDHLAGQPRGVMGWVLVPLMLPLHIIGELAKPLSLALRLFGNITGEDVLVAAFVGLGVMALAFTGSPVGLPLNLPFIFLGILLSLIQALVFTLLSSIYILMMLPHEEHH
ncbi:MAG: F0F1 ATP synthase subunit A [candidate division Zixibacteria bacterium]|jgi:F-type H+-transporting ATPase subunit a|nr:F0F1 ATP synthase subunit A [candidate division Zixibacteria bacterium]